jgi:hypothetical protein
MRPVFYFLLAIGTLGSTTAIAQDTTDYIPSEQRAVLGQWLKHNPALRVATDTDCQCSDGIAEIRKGSGGVWTANPNYASGDFNSDGEQDSAVVLIDGATKLHLVIFNGPISIGIAPAYQSTKYVGPLFFGAPRPKPYRLVVGDFGSDGGLFKPKGKSYVYVGSDFC